MRRFLSLILLTAITGTIASVVALPIAGRDSDTRFVPAPSNGAKITLTTALEPGSEIKIAAEAASDSGLWIDLNGNKSFDEGEELILSHSATGSEADYHSYRISNGEIAVYGNAESLFMKGNKLTSIDLGEMFSLKILDLSYNELESVSVSNQFDKIEKIDVSHNKLRTIRGISILPSLKILDCSSNNISIIHPSNFQGLEELYCQNNRIYNYLFFHSNPKIKKVVSYGNFITDQDDNSKYMTKLIESLPQRPKQDPGQIIIAVVGSRSDNETTPVKVLKLDLKNWQTFLVSDTDGNNPSEYPHYKVTLEKTSGGAINFISQNYESKKTMSFPKGLKISVKMKEIYGFHLVSLTANDRDITPSGSAYNQDTDKEEQTFNVYDILIDQPTTIRAAFEKNLYKITKEITGKGKVVLYNISNPDNQKIIEDFDHVRYGTKVKIEAVPEKGWEVFSITENYGGDKIKDPTFDVRYNELISVEFRQQSVPVHIIKKGKGKVRLNINYPDNVEVGTVIEIIEATAEKHWQLKSIVANGRDITEERRFTVDKETNLIITFEQITHKLILDYDHSQGSLKVKEEYDLDKVPEGSMVTIVARPQKGYELETLTVDNENIIGFMSFTMIKNSTVKATFRKATGIEEVSGQEQLKVIADAIGIRIISPEQLIGQGMAIYSVDGTRIISSRITGHLSRIDVDLPKGIYILKAGGRTIKFLKN